MTSEGRSLSSTEEAAMSGDSHERGEYVAGLGWACVTCDTFGCAVVNAPTDACIRKGCGRPKAEHEMGFCPRPAKGALRQHQQEEP